MATTRPVNLSLTAFRFPIAAITSILHRVSGIVIFVGVGYLTYLLSLTLDSRESFNDVVSEVKTSFHGILVWVVLSCLLYHFVAGIRHMLLDCHIGTSLAAARASAWVVLAGSVMGSLVLGVYILV